MASLYELTQEFLEIRAQLEDLDIDEETFQDTLDSYSGDIQDKADNVMKYIKELEARAKARKEEAKRLNGLASSDLKKAENLKKYLTGNLIAAGFKRGNPLETTTFKFSFRKGTETVEVNEERLPEEYFVPQPPKPMGKTDLKNLVKEGKEIPGVSIIQNPDSLQVK
jgi:Siphovirus Gp157